jgi:hypothetical protein
LFERGGDDRRIVPCAATTDRCRRRTSLHPIVVQQCIQSKRKEKPT